MDNKKQVAIKVKINPIRREGGSRTYSNYVRVVSGPRDITFQFCDIKPPTSDENTTNLRNSQVLKPLIDAEIVLPIDVAQSLLNVLRGQLEKVGKKMNPKSN